MIFYPASPLVLTDFDVVNRGCTNPNIVLGSLFTELAAAAKQVIQQVFSTPVVIPVAAAGCIMGYVYNTVSKTVNQHVNPLIRIPTNLLYTCEICFPYRSVVTYHHVIHPELPLIKDYYGIPITQRHWPLVNAGWYKRHYGRLLPADQCLIYHYPKAPKSIINLVSDFDWKCESVSPHPAEAEQRNAARFNLPSMAHRLGFVPFTISGRPNEASLGFNLIYNYRDTERLMRNDLLTDRNAIILVDTDYYIDMPALLTTGLPILMYTFVPESLAGCTQGSNYYIDGHNCVQFRAAGGTTWSHQLWDYNHDYVTSPTVNNRVVSYQVHQIQLGNNRRVIILYPRTVAPDMASIEKTPLIRTNFTQGQFCIMKTKEEDQLISLSSGDEHVLQLPLEVFYELRGRFRNWKQADILYNVACLEQNAKVLLQNRSYTTEQVNRVVARISVLHAYLKEHSNDELYTLEHYTDMLHYRYDNGQIWGTTLKHAQRATMMPLTTNPNVAPVTDVDADKTMVFGRVDIVHNKIVPPHIFNHYAHEFIQLTLAGVHNLHPMDLEQVFKNQNGPQQKARRKHWFTIINPEPTTSVASFTKSESYSGVKWPRAITQTSTHNMIELSSFTYQLKNLVLKRNKWYGPGKNPSETVRALQELANKSTTLIEKDYSKFDGTISRWLRENVELALLLAAFEPQYHATISKNIQTELDAVAKSKNNVKYKTDGGRLSGSAITTDGNTIINAFVSYAALRRVLSKEEAWEAMGLYYGDDGVDISIQGVDFEKTAIMLGLKVKNIVVNYGQPLGYLGRRYPNIWISTTSYTPLDRALSKLHLVNSSSITLTEAMANKAMGYKVIDAKTPILSWYCDRILQIYQANPNTMTFQQLEDISNPWPQDDVNLIRADIANRHGDICTVENHEAIKRWSLAGQPPVVIDTGIPELNQDRPAQVLGHYIDEKPPLVIKQYQLEQRSFKEEDVPGDGNCFFHCLNKHGIARQLEPQEIRKILRQYVNSYNPNDYPGCVFAEELQDNAPVGLEVISIAAHWLGVTIGVRVEENNAQFLCGGKGSTYWINYRNGHYTALYFNMRPVNTIPCDLLIYLRHKAECKHKAPEVERADREYNKFYEDLDPVFQPKYSTIDVHDTYEGVNPSWKVVEQLKPQNAKALHTTKCKNLVHAIAKILGLKQHLACYIQVLCQQRQFYGLRQASMTDWDSTLDMRVHPFMMVRNLASLLHLDLTVRFATSRNTQMIRYSVSNPDNVIFLNYSTKDNVWYTTDAPSVSNRYDTSEQTETSNNQANNKNKTRRQTNGRNHHNDQKKPAATPKQANRQPGSVNSQRKRSTRSVVNRPKSTSRDSNTTTTLPPSKLRRNEITKSRKTIRSLAPKQVDVKNQLSSVSDDKRSSANRMVTNTSPDRRRRDNVAMVERLTTHEEPATQKREPGAQPPDSN